MRSTKSYGVVSCWQEHKMLVQAEHTYERKRKQLDKVKDNLSVARHRRHNARS